MQWNAMSIMGHNGLHKISTGIDAKTYRAALKLLNGNSLKFGTTTRINFMRCYRQLI